MEVMSLDELIVILEQAQAYLVMFGCKDRNGEDGILPIEALGLAGLPAHAAVAIGRQISLAPVRSFRDVLPEYADMKYSEAYSDMRIYVGVSMQYYLGEDECFFVWHPDIILHHLQQLRSLR